MIYFAAISLNITGAPLAETLLNGRPLNGDYRAAREQLADVVLLAQAIETARQRGTMTREEMDRVAPVEAQLRLEVFALSVSAEVK